MTAQPTGVVALALNPRAGRGRGLAIGEEINHALSDIGIPVKDTTGQSAAETAELTRAAVAAGVDAVIVVGGD
ncbi:MAG: diacylglycerol kinase family protein, partial [Angustibacter sp.]